MLAKHVEKLFEEFKSQGWSDERKAELFADFLREDEHTDDFLDWLHGKYGADDEDKAAGNEVAYQDDEDDDISDDEQDDTDFSDEEEGDEPEAQSSSGEAMVGNIPQEELWGG